MDTQLEVKPMVLAPLPVQEEFVMDWENRAVNCYVDNQFRACAMGQYAILHGAHGNGLEELRMSCAHVAEMYFPNDDIRDNIGLANDQGQKEELVRQFAGLNITLRFK